MNKKEMKLYIAQLVESGKGLGLASLMEKGPARSETERVLNLSIDSIAKQLELLCDDAAWKEKEVSPNA